MPNEKKTNTKKRTFLGILGAIRSRAESVGAESAQNEPNRFYIRRLGEEIAQACDMLSYHIKTSTPETWQ